MGKENFARDAVRAFRAGVRNDGLVLDRLDSDTISPEDAKSLFKKGREVADSDTDSEQAIVNEVYENAKEQLEKAYRTVCGRAIFKLQFDFLTVKW